MNPLHSLPLKEKVAQLVFPFIDGRSLNKEELKKELTEYKYGGYIVFYLPIFDTFNFLNELQSISEIPLLISADVEMGTGGIFYGGTLLPPNMAIAATNNSANAYFCGEITAKESRALGVHLAYAPVVDINNNPNNPIINLRAYSDNKDTVSQMAKEFIKGAKKYNLLTTAKHFPGHGNTNIDSHITLPIINVSLEELWENELVPFKETIDIGVDAVMIGHIGVPCLDLPNVPATLSYNIVQKLLREQMGFKGLIVVDAMIMGAITEQFSNKEATIRSILAGCDIILMPINPKETVEILYNAVINNEISEDRINESLDRLFIAKQKINLFENKLVDINTFNEVFSDQNRFLSSLNLTIESITLVKNESNTIPINTKDKYLVVIYNDDNIADIEQVFIDELKRQGIEFETIGLNRDINYEFIPNVIKQAKEYNTVISAVFSLVSPGKGYITLNPVMYQLYNELKSLNKKLIVVSFSSPYILNNLTNIDSYICTYNFSNYSQIAAVQVLTGKIIPQGKLPIKL